MKKQLCFLTTSLFLLLLSACGGEPAGTWTPVEDFQFTLEEAAGVDGTAFTPDGFDPARINDPDHNYNPKGWLDENTVLCTRSAEDIFDDTTELVAVTLEGAVTELDVEIDPYTMVTAQDGVVIYGKCYETALPDGVTFARWNGTEDLTPIYQFEDGAAITFQQFFSPDGTKAVMSWISEIPGNDWKVRIIDLNTGAFQDLTPPELEGGAPEFLFSRWLDDGTILVTAASDLANGGDAAAWEYSLPQ